MSERQEPPDKIKAFIDEVVLLCKKYNAHIIATDDYGMQINVDDQEYGGDFNVCFYRITDEGLS